MERTRAFRCVFFCGCVFVLVSIKMFLPNLRSWHLNGTLKKTNILAPSPAPWVLNKNNLSRIEKLRTGFGLEPYTTEDGEKVWIENGVIYRHNHEARVKKLPLTSVEPEFEPYLPFNASLFFEDDEARKLAAMKSEKKIVLWWEMSRFIPVMQKLEPFRGCPDLPCVMTTNRSFKDQSAALVFAGQTLQGSPPARRSDQVFIFNNLESIGNSQPTMRLLKQTRSPWNSVFNWTMTYHLDADVFSPYGIVRLRREPVRKNYTEIVSQKTKPVAWQVSSCGVISKRDEYVKVLQKYIPVDIYGKCGSEECIRDDDIQCLRMITQKYKFYLAFENTLCKDYATEKFFRYLSQDLVVVTRGCDEVAYHAPRDTFINARDYKTPKELAEHLLYLDRNDDAYRRILEEKNKFMVLYERHLTLEKSGKISYIHYHYDSIPFCRVFQRLWNIHKYRKSIPDIHQWLDQRGCWKANDY